MADTYAWLYEVGTCPEHPEHGDFDPELRYCPVCGAYLVTTMVWREIPSAAAEAATGEAL